MAPDVKAPAGSTLPGIGRHDDATCEYRDRLRSVSQSLFDARKGIEQANVLIALSHVPHGIQETARLRAELTRLQLENMGLKREMSSAEAQMNNIKAQRRRVTALTAENAQLKRERDACAALAGKMGTKAAHDRLRFVSALGGLFGVLHEARALGDTQTVADTLERLAHPDAIQDEIDLALLLGVAQQSVRHNLRPVVRPPPPPPMASYVLSPQCYDEMTMPPERRAALTIAEAVGARDMKVYYSSLRTRQA